MERPYGYLTDVASLRPKGKYLPFDTVWTQQLDINVYR